MKSLAQANETFIPSIVIGELYYGARKSARTQANLKRVDELVSNSTVLGCDVNTATQTIAKTGSRGCGVTS